MAGDSVHDHTGHTERYQAKQTGKHGNIPVGKKVNITFKAPTAKVTIRQGQALAIDMEDPGVPNHVTVHAQPSANRGTLAWTVDDAQVVVLQPPLDKAAVRVVAKTPGSTDVHVKFNLGSSEATTSIRVSVRAAQISTDTHEIDFGKVAVGAKGSKTLTIENKSEVTLKLANVGLSGNITKMLAVEPRSASVPRGGTQALQLTFAPTAAGKKDGSLKLYSNDPAQRELEVRLTAEGSRPVLKLSPTEIDFQGALLKTSKSQNLKVENTGDAPLKVEKLSLAGDGAAAYSLASTNVEVAAGQSQDVQISFKPEQAGTLNASVSVVSNDSKNSPASVALKGIGQRPQLELSASAKDFGEKMCSVESKETLELKNIGDVNLEITAIDKTGEAFDFKRSEGFLSPLPPEKTTSLELIFKPTSEGPASGGLTIKTNDPLQPENKVSLKGVGQKPKIKLEASSKDLGGCNLGKTIEATLSVENLGGVDLEIKEVKKVEGGEEFEAVLDPQGPVKKGTPASLKITFKPAEKGNRSGKFAIASNDPETPSCELSLSGKGTAPKLVLDPADEIAWQTDKGKEESRTVQVKNTGDGPLKIESFELSGEGAAAFSLEQSNAEKELDGGASTSVSVTFKPTELAEKTAELHVKSDDPDEPLKKLPLKGTGLGWIAFKFVDKEGATLAQEEFELEMVLPGDVTEKKKTVSGELRVEKLKAGAVTVKSITCTKTAFCKLKETN